MLLVRLAVLGAAGIVVFSYEAIGRVVSFKEVTAVVDDVSFKCHREGATLGHFWSADPKAIRDCSEVELSPNNRAPIRPAVARTLSVRYVSPADQREHRGSIRTTGFPEKFDQIPADKRLQILARRNNPDVIQTVGRPEH